MVVAKLRRDFKGNQSGTIGLRSSRLRLRHSGISKTNAAVIATGAGEEDDLSNQLPTPHRLRPLSLLSKRIPSLAESVVSELDPSSSSNLLDSFYDRNSSSSVSEHQRHLTTIQKRPRIIEEVVSGELRTKIHQQIIKFVELLPPSLGSPVNNIYALIVLAAVSQQPWILVYGALWILFQSVAHVFQKWFKFYAHDREIIRCTRCVKVFVGRVLDEGNKALSGNYARRVVAAYLIVSSTGPGESSVGKVIRYKTASINKQVVDQIDHSLRSGFQ